MGMAIDKTIEFFNGLECHTPQAKDARDVAVNTMCKYQQLQADYETHLKADMVAMLTELDSEIDKIPIVTRHGVTGTVMTAQGMRKKIKENIQQKIDDLKGKQA